MTPLFPHSPATGNHRWRLMSDEADNPTEAQVEAMRDHAAKMSVLVDSIRHLACAIQQLSLAANACNASIAIMQNGGNPGSALRSAVSAIDSAKVYVLHELPTTTEPPAVTTGAPTAP